MQNLVFKKRLALIVILNKFHQSGTTTLNESNFLQHFSEFSQCCLYRLATLRLLQTLKIALFKQKCKYFRFQCLKYQDWHQMFGKRWCSNVEIITKLASHGYFCTDVCDFRIFNRNKFWIRKPKFSRFKLVSNVCSVAKIAWKCDSLNSMALNVTE